MPQPINLGAQLDDAWADLVSGWSFDQATKDDLILEYARARDRQIGDWADRAEDLDGLTAASREGVIRRRLESERRRAA